MGNERQDMKMGESFKWLAEDIQTSDSKVVTAYIKFSVLCILVSYLDILLTHIPGGPKAPNIQLKTATGER